MKVSAKKGIGFGLTSGIITTLGLIVGLNSGTHSKIVVLGGILIIAIADALSDSMGIHMSEEFGGKHKTKEIWEATGYTFISKLIFALTFVIPVLLFTLSTAVIISVIWGLLLISIFSYIIAKQEKAKPYKIISEHILIAIVVILVTNYLGIFVSGLG